MKPGDVITLKLPADKLHMFHAESGLTINRSLARGRGRSRSAVPAA